MREALTVGLLMAGMAAWGQSPTPSAKIGRPMSPAPAPIVRAAGADPWDDAPQPTARLGPITSGEIGKGPSDASEAELYNWGVPPKRSPKTGQAPDRARSPFETASRTKASDERSSRERDREDDGDERSARLREPVRGRSTNNDKGFPVWLEENTKDLRDGFYKLGDTGEPDRLPFESERSFQDFVSPISNPFLAEDPRSLTELRPIFIYQTIPNKQYLYQGGNTSFFGLQARLAFSDRFSVVLNKLGGNIFNAGETGTLAPTGTGLSEIWLSPKFVFYRDTDTQTLASAGLTFQLPFGSSKLYQDTGKLGLTPYVSYGQPLWRTGAGRFSFMNTTGYTLGTNEQRSDYLFTTAQLSLDLLDYHRFYPVVELSWFHYTSNGTERPFYAFEGRDLANVGAPVSGRDFITIAPGFRFNLTEYMQFGLSTEFPLNGPRDLHRFRLGIDFIWRY